MEIMDFETRCVHAAKDASDTTGSIALPIYQTATFSHPNVGESTGYNYSRLQNPTREVVEKTIAVLEGGIEGFAFSSGMAAMSTLMELFSPGDHLIASDDLYGGVIRLFDNISKKNGVSVDYIDTSDIACIAQHCKPNTKAIFLETPTNPMMHVSDIAEVSKLAKEKRAWLIVDNTFSTPYFQKPLLLGADIVMHSGTKYLGGHNDTLAGFLVAGSEELCEKLQFISKTMGAVLSPFDSFLIQRGIKTLALRMDRIEKNALVIAEWLQQQPKVKKVHYVGLENHPSYAVSCKQTTGFGGMISFETVDAKAAVNVLNNVEIIQYAESLGGVESLITYPILQTHADVPQEKREAIGITDCLLRLSVGIESVQDLIHDLKQALQK